MKTRMLSLSAGLALAFAGSASAAEPWISQIFFNPPSTDQGHERVTIAGEPGMSLAGYWFIVMEGENVPGGMIDQLIDLSTYTLGTNGLLMIADDGTIVLDPAPAAGTNVVVFDFSPDIENGANTFILAKGTPGFAVGQDFDQGPTGPTEIGDGILDPGSLPGVTCVDAVGWIDPTSTAADYDYAGDPQVGFPNGALGKLFDPTNTAYNAEAFVRLLTADCKAPGIWAGGDLDGTNPGPYAWNISAGRNFGFTAAGLDPATETVAFGSPNSCAKGGPTCYPDCDGDTVLSIDDFICFQTFFALNDPYADCDGDTVLSIDDFICFQTFFAIGC